MGHVGCAAANVSVTLPHAGRSEGAAVAARVSGIKSLYVPLELGARIYTNNYHVQLNNVVVHPVRVGGASTLLVRLEMDFIHHLEDYIKS